MTPRVVLASAGGLVLAGCSLIYASDLDDARTTVTSDGGGANADGAPVSTGPDAGLDAAKPDAGPARGCGALVPAPQFCEDFDTDAPIGADWDEVDTQAGPVAYDTSQFFSGRRSAKSTLATPKTCQYSRLGKGFNAVGTKRVETHVKLRPASPWTDQIAFVLALGNTAADTECMALVYVYKDATGGVSHTELNVQSDPVPNDVHQLNGFPAQNSWTDVGIVATPLSGGGNHYQVSFTPDGQASVVNELDFPQCPAWDTAGIYAGFHCATGKAVANYDDVTFDSK